jgi:PEP-CTERM motif
MSRLRLCLVEFLSALGLLAVGPVAAVLGMMALGGQAEASVVIDIYQSGGDVITTESGSVDLTDLTYNYSSPGQGGMTPSAGDIVIGGPANGDVYFSVSGPASFGTGGFASASSNSGDVFAIGLGQLAVPSGYVSGTALSGSSTYDGQTLVSLGLTPGKYVYTWGSRPDADSLTVDITSVPEPSTWAMMILGFAGLGLAGYRTSRGALSVA